MKGEELYEYVHEGMKIEPGVGDKIRAGAKLNETISIATIAKLCDDLSGDVADAAKGKVARMLKECMADEVKVKKGVGDLLRKGMDGTKDHIRRSILADVVDRVAGIPAKKGKGKKGQVAEAVDEPESVPEKD